MNSIYFSYFYEFPFSDWRWAVFLWFYFESVNNWIHFHQNAQRFFWSTFLHSDLIVKVLGLKTIKMAIY